MGRIKNGDLLAQAESHAFDVMITADKNLSYQQNLSSRKLALIILSTNNWNILRDNIAPALDALERATPGSFQTVLVEIH